MKTANKNKQSGPKSSSYHRAYDPTYSDSEKVQVLVISPSMKKREWRKSLDLTMDFLSKKNKILNFRKRWGKRRKIGEVILIFWKHTKHKNSFLFESRTSTAVDERKPDHQLRKRMTVTSWMGRYLQALQNTMWQKRRTKLRHVITESIAIFVQR